MNVRVSVYVSLNARTDNKCIFRRDVEVLDSLEFPYSKIHDSLKVLFGNINGCIIEFLIL